MYRGVWYTGAINEEEGERYADGGYAGNAEKLLPEGAAVPADGAISAPCAADLLPGDVGGIAALDRTGLIDYYGGDLSPGVRHFGYAVRFGGLGRCIAICHAKNDLSEDRCRKCGVPLLK